MVTKRERVCVGMSGGVDSSVAAYLLLEQGYQVIGLTFRNWPQDCISRAEDKCCGPQAVTDARMVAHRLGIPHYVVDEIAEFQREVIDYFVAEYQRGRTPNPCVVCNEKIKFGSFWRRAAELGATKIATGHYARVEPGNPPRLFRGRDPRKDQSYFLFSLRPEQLARALFPLGEMSKEETRAIARKLGLKTQDKVESQEICFVPDKDYVRFLREGAKIADRPGEIVTRDGQVLGQHPGIHYFTIGQREGLRLGGQREPRYVMALDAEANRVVVGSAAELMRDQFEIADCHWLAEPTGEVTVKIRYNHPGCAAEVRRLDETRARVHLREPQRAITPGQAAVVYRGDEVLGGGWIC
ncbi:MAG: tRNA 2-thiouridine(34) synthase MnmA [Verrucomicrobiae bacterium]|nr:tRNA 2-thiouridine(34) synthase MnmA [Verrucomicrobiae bacterium]